MIFLFSFKYICFVRVKINSEKYIFILAAAILKVVCILNKHFFAFYITYYFSTKFMSCWKWPSRQICLLVSYNTICFVPRNLYPETVSLDETTLAKFFEDQGQLFRVSHSLLFQSCDAIFLFNQVLSQDFVELLHHLQKHCCEKSYLSRKEYYW